MNYKLMFMINAVVAALFGVAFLVLPDFVFKQFASESYIAMVLLARFFGGTLLMSAVLMWFMTNADEELQRSVAFVLLAGAIGGFVLSLMGIAGASAVIRANGWVLLVIYVIFGLGYAYLLFLQPPAAEPKRRASRKSKNSSPKNPSPMDTVQ